MYAAVTLASTTCFGYAISVFHVTCCASWLPLRSVIVPRGTGMS